MSRKEREQQNLSETPVTYPEIDALLRGFLRHERLLPEAVRAGLAAHHFSYSPEEFKYQLLFSALL
jgi:hypothetical protein